MKWPRWLYCMIWGHFKAVDIDICLRCAAKLR